MVQQINGYACHNPADTALARRGVNPGKPNAPAAGVAAIQGATGRQNQQPAGLLQGSADAEPARRSAPPAGRGRRLDLIA